MPRGGTTAPVKKSRWSFLIALKGTRLALVTFKLSVSALASGSLPCHYVTAKAVSLDTSGEKWGE